MPNLRKLGHHCGTIILSQHKRYKTTAQLKAEAAIKRLNYENKHLFGELIKPETAKVKRSNSIKKDDAVRKKPIDTINETHLSTSSDNYYPLFNAVKPIINREINSGLILPALSTVSDKKFPSVTKILRDTMSPTNRLILERWKAKLIKQMGEQGFINFNQNQMSMGVELHKLIHQYLRGIPKCELNVIEELRGCWRSLESTLDLVSNVKVIESAVVHRDLEYMGIVDCIAFFKDTPMIIDWKKSEKYKGSIATTYDSPLQLCAYMGALNYDINYDFRVDNALLVISYVDGTRAELYHLDSNACQKYWKKWLVKLAEYKKISSEVTPEDEI